jgi:hypothetical protein
MDINWPTLQRLRRGFLAGTAGNADYWRTENDLRQYDDTFAQRIGWKWDFVLRDLAELGWQPTGTNIVDWGCGSGIASRAVLDQFGRHAQTKLWLSDRSSLAVRFATDRARAKYPELRIEKGIPDRVDLLLISHVLTEMSQPQIEQLVQLATKASAVLWVEPGTYEVSLTLIAIRERLRKQFQLVAPCTHQNQCGILTPGNEGHWCHFFAEPPREIFTDGFWTRFGQEMEIDLRSLPLSYLVLDRRPAQELTENSTRVLGRPNLFKPYAEILGCSGKGVCACKVMKRTHPDVYRQLKKGKCPSRLGIETEGDQVTGWKA